MPELRQGISAVDMITSGEIFAAAGPPAIPVTRRFFRYFAPQDKWELWEVRTTGPAVDPVLIATRNEDDQQWVVEP